MSSNLYWLPEQPSGGNALGDGLKFVLRSEYDFPVALILGRSDVPFLRGVARGAGDKSEVARDARKLIEAIEKHDSIRVWEC